MGIWNLDFFFYGTYIKSWYKECFFSVVSKDDTDDLFMITHAIDNGEYENNCEWFCLKLKQLYEGPFGTGFTRYMICLISFVDIFSFHFGRWSFEKKN